MQPDRPKRFPVVPANAGTHTPGVNCCRRHLPPITENENPRRMGPGVRQAKAGTTDRYSASDISAALPPEAAVLMVTVCSVAKRAR